FLKGELQPKLNNAMLLAVFAIIFSVIVSAGVSTLAFRPLEKISRKLDEMSAGSVVPAPPPVASHERDEYGVVNTKIERLGQQMRDVKEVFSALQENLDQIMTNLQDGVILFTREEKAVLVSSAIERFLQKSRIELLGKTPEEVFGGYPVLLSQVTQAFEQRRSLPQTEIMMESAGSARLQLSVDFIEENGHAL